VYFSLFDESSGTSDIYKLIDPTNPTRAG
jgi:hypothetical protein